AARMQKALATVAQIFFLAGAREVFMPIHGHERLGSIDEALAFAGRSIKGTEFDLIAFHPSGTCRMGSDPRQSVVDSYGQSHELRGLFVADGSVIPTPLGRSEEHTSELQSPYDLV